MRPSNLDFHAVRSRRCRRLLAVFATAFLAAASAQAQAPAMAPAAGSTNGVAKARKQILVFENADLRVVLQAMAKQEGLSLILPDDVKGNVTARLVDIPVRQAMETILASKGYSLVEMDGVFTVKSKEAINTEPLKSEIYQFANASAKETRPIIEKLLSKASGANVQLDERSNTLLLSDVPSNLSKILPILKTLDSVTPQVLIETKLLEMTRNPQEAIGVNWQSLSSYQVGLASPNGALVAGGDNKSSGKINLGITRSGDPGAIGAANAGRAGGILTPMGLPGYPFAAVLEANVFNITLSFLMQDKDSELLGSPKVITADNKEAIIKITRQEPIPNFTFNQQTASFVISGFEFKDVGNILKVTPHVNKDNFITMDVEPQVSTSTETRNFALPGGSVDIPLISIRTLTSKVMVKSGNTLALGGLLESASTRTYTKVPLLGDIPGLGELFRSRNYNKTKRNLLIFITPTVVASDGSTGLEDQYSQLRETDENDRFGYRKSFWGNAKPHDQFKAFENNAPGVPSPPPAGIQLSPGSASTKPTVFETAPMPRETAPRTDGDAEGVLASSLPPKSAQTAIVSPPPAPSVPSLPSAPRRSETENSADKEKALEAAEAAKQAASEINPDHLNPRLAPRLRD
ncbi:MAG: hypothetical protein IT578_12090 [Verrucomicrobiae bacterium]|nr:hypothetical protein [Verrucomicrobiae bacterium]